MRNFKKTKKNFILLLNEIKKKSGANFSGVGLVLYDSRKFSKKHFSPLRPSMKCPKHISFDNREKMTKFLLKFSQFSHSLHDGYHFLNEKGRLTHVAQYFWPPIIDGIKPDEKYGTRHLSAKYGVHIRGVIAIGIINHNCNIFYFIRGKTQKL